MPVSDEFVVDEMDDGEYVHDYCPGGLHPVHIGDRLDGDRYKVVHKLGYGATSTVWLARDRDLDIYVAVKIKQSRLSKLHNEVDILKHLSKAKSDHPGRSYSAASLLLRLFWIDGPNGHHLALVLQVRGPSIARLYYWNIRLHSSIARSIALQVTQGLEYLHSEGICHGDFTSSDVLLQLTNFDSWSEYRLKKQLGSPRKLSINRLPGRPRYLVDSASFFNAEPGLLTKNITIVDHSESFFIKNPPAHEIHTTNYSAAPEVLFGTNINFHSDIWALGCLIYEMRAGYPIFSTAMDNAAGDAVSEIVLMLGQVPSPWDSTLFDENGDLTRDGSGEPTFLFSEYIIDTLPDRVNEIEDKMISLPDFNIELEGSKLPKEPWMKLSSSDINGGKIRPHIKDDPSRPWEPALSASIMDIVLIECSSPQLLVQASMEIGVAPLRKISKEESHNLTDLLSQILTYKPEDRTSLSNIAKHPWLTASVEST